MKSLYTVCTLLLLSQATLSQTKTLFCKQLTSINKIIQTSHYQPKPLDDSLSKGVFELFLNRLDNNNTIFLSDDIAQFKADEFQIDNHIANNDCSFIKKYTETLKKRLEASKKAIESLKDVVFDYSGKDTLYYSSAKSLDYLDNNTQITNYWNKRIRYLIVSEAIDQDSIFDNLKDNFSALEQTLKPKIIQNQVCRIDEILHKNGDLNITVQEAFLDAFAKYQDPNSSFFNEIDKTLFETTVSNNQLTFGITTSKNDDGEIIIAHITPGSSASINGNFETGDILKSLASGNDFLETYCVSNDDITAFLTNAKHTTTTFKIKKQNGSVQDINLTKSVVKVEENTTTGYVLQNNTNIGYIKIPGFYTDFESPNGLGLANDVAKELLKLEKEDIKGLVLDLRYNGGGSMKEASDLSGMFINRGPLAILKYSSGETFTIKDVNRGSLFQKPIVVLIDNYSASASEFFASAMQDYNRAIIVGAKSHGKSSVQIILPIDEKNNLGFLKLTTESFFRVTGKSHQSTGVIPDVLLPYIYDEFKTGELHEKYALKNDSVTVNLKHIPLQPLPINKLQSLSKLRIDKNLGFEAVKNINKSILNNYITPDYQYALTLKNVFDYFDDYAMLWQNFSETMAKNESKIAVKNTITTQEILQYNENDTSLNTEILKNIASDIYIEEAFHIITDLINLKPAN